MLWLYNGVKTMTQETPITDKDEYVEQLSRVYNAVKKCAICERPFATEDAFIRHVKNKHLKQVK